MGDRALRQLERDLITFFGFYNDYLEKLKCRLEHLSLFMKRYDTGNIAEIQKILEDTEADTERGVHIVDRMRETCSASASQVQPDLLAALARKYGLAAERIGTLPTLLHDMDLLVSKLKVCVVQQRMLFEKYDGSAWFFHRQMNHPDGVLRCLIQETSTVDPTILKKISTDLPSETVVQLLDEEIGTLKTLTRLGKSEGLGIGLTPDTSLFAKLHSVVDDIGQLMQMHNRSFNAGHIEEEYDVIVIGGGSSGMALISELRKSDPSLKILCIDKQGTYGGNWRYYPSTMYMNSEIGDMSGNQEDTVSFPHCALAKTPVAGKYQRKDYLNMGDMAAYLDAASQTLDLPPPVQDLVLRVRRLQPGERKDPQLRYALHTYSGRVFAARYVVIATGIFDSPRAPAIENFFADEFVEIKGFNDLRNDIDICTGDEFFTYYQRKDGGVGKDLCSYLEGKRSVVVYGTKLTAIKMVNDILTAAETCNPDVVVFSVSRNAPLYTNAAGINPESERLRRLLEERSGRKGTPGLWFEPYTERASYHSATQVRSISGFLRTHLEEKSGTDHVIHLRKRPEYGAFIASHNGINQCERVAEYRTVVDDGVDLRVDGIVYAIGFDASTHIVDPDLLRTKGGYILDPTAIVSTTRESANAQGIFLMGIIIDMPVRRSWGSTVNSFTRAAIEDAGVIAATIKADLQKKA